MSDEPCWSLEKCVVNYKAKLIVIIAELFRLARIVPGEVPDVASGSVWDITLPRYCWQKVLALLTPAESALRRLIIMAAHGKPIAPYVPEEQAAKTEVREVAGGELCEAMAQEIIIGPAEAVSVPLDETAKDTAAVSPRPPVFDMFDPMKKFGFCGFYDDDEWEALQAQKAAAGPLIIPKADRSKRMDPVNALGLWKRIQALHHAAENFEACVARYISWYQRQRYQLKNNLKLTGRKRLGLMRGGYAPGYIRKGKHDIHGILRDVHNLAFECLSPLKDRLKPG
jgi:hypothetical protein